MSTDLPDLIAGALGVSRGTAYDMMREALAEQSVQQTCNCRWEGEVQVQQCTLHEAHIDAIHEWAGRAKAAEAKLAEQPAQQEPVAIHQFRKCGCSDWYDGVPDHHDGQGPYEVRTLYTTPQAQPAREPLTDELWGLLDAIENELNRRAIPEVWLLVAHKAGRAYIEAAHGITKGNT